MTRPQRPADVVRAFAERADVVRADVHIDELADPPNRVGEWISRAIVVFAEAVGTRNPIAPAGPDVFTRVAFGRRGWTDRSPSVVGGPATDRAVNPRAQLLPLLPRVARLRASRWIAMTLHDVLAARRAVLTGFAIPLLAGCPPDLSPKGHLALPSGRLLPVYATDETVLRDGGVEYRAWRVSYETRVPLADGKALADEAFGEILSTIAAKADHHGLAAVVLSPTEVPEVHAQTLVGLPIPYYTWQWHSYAYTVIHRRDNLWHVSGSDRVGAVSDTVRAVVAAIDSVEGVTDVGQRVVQIRRDEKGVVVTLAALTAGPFDGTTDVRVNGDGQIRAIEPLH